MAITFYPEGTRATPNDSEQRSLTKIVDILGSGGGTNLSGSGSPEGSVVGTVGQGYVNTNNGNYWVKQTGTGNTGWVIVTGGGSGHDNITGSGSPVGVKTPDYIGQYYTNLDSPEGGIWVSTGITNADWRVYVGI
jgi:hypothetical protein